MAATTSNDTSDSEIVLSRGSIADKVQRLFKVTVIGPVSVGKTSLIRRLTDSVFTPNFKATIGVDFGLIIAELDGERNAIQLWDIAGNEGKGGMLKLYIRDTLGILIVCSLDIEKSIDETLLYKTEAITKLQDSHPDRTVPCILLINKCDLSILPNRDYAEFASKNGFDKHFLVSAKTGEGLNDAIIYLTRQMIARHVVPAVSSAATPLVLDKTSETKGGCCG